MKKNKKKLVWPIFAAFVLLLNLVFPYIGASQVANAAEVNLKNFPNYLEKVTIHNTNNSFPSDSTIFSNGAGTSADPYVMNVSGDFRVKYNYSLPDGENVINAQDSYVIEVPNHIKAPNISEAVKIPDENGINIGEYTINNNKILIKFYDNTDFLNKNNRKFTLWFSAKLNEVVADQVYELKFDNGQSYYVKVTKNSDYYSKETLTVYKGGDAILSPNGNLIVHWTFYFSYLKEFKIPKGSVIKDVIPDDQTLDRESLIEGFAPYTTGSDPIFKLDIASDNKSFEITVLKDTSKDLYIGFDTIPNKPDAEGNWLNHYWYKGAKDSEGNSTTESQGTRYPNGKVDDYDRKASARYQPSAGAGALGSLPKFTLQKKWQTGDIPPASIDVKILQNGELYRTVTLKADENWTTTVENYPLRKGSEVYTYTVEEVPVAGYNKAPQITGDQKTGFTITNEKIKNITVTKQWLDDGNHAAVDATVTGKVGETQVSTQDVTLDSTKDFKVTLENLPFFKDGKEINYTVKEKNVPTGFKSDVTGNEQDGFTITNTKMMDIQLKKNWIDDGSSPNSIVVEVSNGKDPPIDVTLEKANNYEAKITVPKFGKDTKVFEHVYTVKEKNVPAGYASKVTGDAAKGFVITNTKVKDIPVEKKWLAGTENTPDTVDVTLSGAGEKYELTLEKAKGYKGKFENIPAFKNGEAIAYTLTEKPVSGYATNIVKDDATGGYVVTNTKLTNIPVEKKWNDQKSSHGTVYVDVYANGQKVKDARTLALDPTNNYKGSFNDLPKYDADNQLIVYTVKEQDVAGYEASVTGDAEAGFVITNTELTTVEAKKVWLDGESTHADVQLDVFGTDTTKPVDTIALKDKGSTTSKPLPKYDASGELITYTVKEQTPAGYKSSVTGNMEAGFTVTNTKVIDVQMTKKWLDGEATHPDVNMLVFASNDTKAVKTVALTAAENYEATIKDLPKYDQAGKEITYTVKEEAVEGYASAVTGNEKDGFTITNTKQTKLDVTKVWIGKGNHPDQVEVSVINDATKEVVETMQLTKDQAFKASTKELPAYDANGEKITYSVKETPIDHYKSTVTGDMETGFTITNMKETTISVSKKWLDGAATHDAITVELYGNDVEKPVQTVELNTANEFKATFTNMPLYTNDGEDIVYTVKEKNVPTGYVSTTTGDVENGFTVTNTKQQTLNFTKVWLDGEKTHPDVTLHVSGSDGSAHEVVLTEANEFKATLTVPQYDEANKEITYTVEEQEMKGYASAITGDVENGYTVTNTKVIDLPVKKVWKDTLDIHGEITVHVLGSDGTDREIKLNEANNFNTTVTQLPKYDAEGNEITYSVKEEAVENYTTTVLGSEAEGYVIVNTFVEKEEVPPTPNGGHDGGTTDDGETPNSPNPTTTPNTTTTPTQPSVTTMKPSYSSSSTTPSVVSSNKVLPQTGMANTNSIVYSGIAVMMLALGLFMYTLRKRKAA